jgi:hypothetical protein
MTKYLLLLVLCISFGVVICGRATPQDDAYEICISLAKLKNEATWKKIPEEIAKVLLELFKSNTNAPKSLSFQAA